MAAYQDFRLLGVRIPDRFTEFVFRRFYAIYDIIRMPRKEEGAAARSHAVRRILQALNSGHVVILFPEGQNVQNFVMRELQPGVGDLVRLAAKNGTPVITIAVAPDGRSFAVSVGAQCDIDQTAGSSEIEEYLGRSIASMLPEQLRGPYGHSASG